MYTLINFLFYEFLIFKKELNFHFMSIIFHSNVNQDIIIYKRCYYVTLDVFIKYTITNCASGFEIWSQWPNALEKYSAQSKIWRELWWATLLSFYSNVVLGWNTNKIRPYLYVSFPKLPKNKIIACIQIWSK